MSGKFHSREGIRNTIKRIEAANSKQKREKTNFAVTTFTCSGDDPACGASHQIEKDRPLPTAEDAIKIMKYKKSISKNK